MEYYARPNQKLIDHCTNVGKIARFFAPKGFAELCNFLGFIHDYGKWNPKWQSYLDKSCKNLDVEQVNHAHYATALIKKLFSKSNISKYVICSLMNIVASHHTGLHDDVDSKDRLIWDCKDRKSVV